jgi:hypothetical protein
VASARAVAAGGALGWEMPGNAVKWPWDGGDAGLRWGTDRRVILIDRGGRVGNGRGLSDWHALETGPLVAEPPTLTSPPPVAEPSTLLMIGTGLLVAVSAGKRRRR